MKKKGLIPIFAIIVSALCASETFAIAGREDNSSLVVWAFLGFCALIVVAQLLPLILQLRIFARLHKQVSEESLEPNPIKVTADK